MLYNYFSAQAQAKADAKAASGTGPTIDDPAEESEESDVELDNEGVVSPDNDPPQEMGDSAKEPTEEEMDSAGDLRSKAAGAYSEQKYEEALKSYTDAIQVNPKNSLFYAKRGQVRLSYCIFQTLASKILISVYGLVLFLF